MDARCLRCLTLLAAATSCAPMAVAGSYQTVNFTVSAERDSVAEQVGKQAEVYRRQLAIFWLGKPLPNWSRPCRITVREGALGAGGQTTFQFVRGEVLNWRMQVQGSLERILDSVLPHEINHTIFACHFRRPLPRWADEGAATLFEHRSEQLKQLALLKQVVNDSSGLITLSDLLSMKEYPRGQRAMLTLYAQGYALADFLVQQKGREAYLQFIGDGERIGWEEAIRKHFEHEGVVALERNWKGWILAGMPKLTLPRDQMLAATSRVTDSARETARPEFVGTVAPDRRQPVARPRPSSDSAVVRSQSPDRTAASVVRATPESKTDSRPSTGDWTLDASSRHEPRRASLRAPVPRPARVGDGAESETPAFFSPDRASSQRANSADRLSAEEEERLFGQSRDRPGLEATRARDAAEAALEANSDDRTLSPASSQSSPVERQGNPGRTPQWAGFPGQSKLF